MELPECHHPCTSHWCAAPRADPGTRFGRRRGAVGGHGTGPRMTAAGINPARARQHLAARRVQVDGMVVSDPDAPAPAPARIVLRS